MVETWDVHNLKNAFNGLQKLYISIYGSMYVKVILFCLTNLTNLISLCQI